MTSFWQTMLLFTLKIQDLYDIFVKNCVIWFSFSSGLGAGTETFPKVGTGTAINGGSTLLPVCWCNGLISARLEKK
jgi:hypothetical protein